MRYVLGIIILISTAIWGLDQANKPAGPPPTSDKPAVYTVTELEQTQIDSSQKDVVIAQLQLEKAQMNYNAALGAFGRQVTQIRDAHHWPSDLLYNVETKTWEKKPSQDKK